MDIIKKEVKSAYAAIARDQGETNCCADAACCGTAGEHSMTVDYSQVKGHVESANLSLGCGIPTASAKISEGDTVIDLGSGAGNDAFVARQIVGEMGKIIGVDMTPEMVILALKNTQKLGFENVDFVLNDIENMTAIPKNTADVVISNCVLNLVSNKKQIFAEIRRILKVGGHFSISDIVTIGEMPKALSEASELYTGCISGASEKGSYLGYIKEAGFKNISISQERKILLPDELLLKYLSAEDLTAYKTSENGIYSITIYADKLEEGVCCETSTSGCCRSEEIV